MKRVQAEEVRVQHFRSALQNPNGRSSSSTRSYGEMILDANRTDPGVFERAFDVCVVGSGPAGTSLARKLASRGHDVVLMEGGDLDITFDSQELYEGEVIGMPYNPMDVARLRYLGGCSNHWGGRCRAQDPFDYEAVSYYPLSGWPITWNDLEAYATETESILDIPSADTVPDRPVDGAESELLYPGFRFSNPLTLFGTKYRGELEASDRITLALNSNLVDLRVNEDGSAVVGAVFKSYRPEDPGFTVRARAYCICLGALENPRAFLNANTQIPSGLGNQNGLVGRYFCEHPTYLVGEVLFEKNVPPKVGYVPTRDLIRRNECLNFNLLVNTHIRRLVTETQRTLACSSDFMTRLAAKVLGRPFNCDVGGLDAYFEGLRMQTDKVGEIGCIAEQALNPESRVLLADETDRFGLRRLALDWRLSPMDLTTYRTSIRTVGEFYARAGIGRVKVADWLLEENPTPPDWGTAGHQVIAHHQMCTTRMSENPREGVVDANCRVHAINNLYVGGSSVFATAGHTNPTYNIVELALRLGDHISEEIDLGHLTAVTPATLVQ
jgi:2-polyprenyl-6-methoxyphenol hydroxylase-like FAD-dependent oxidoreductase